MTLVRACRILQWLAVALFAVVVIRDFTRYIDHYPYLAADDALANVSYSLGTEGRYGFLTSPVQGFTSAARQNGFFNYGPWYFYAGAGLVWLFGYSLETLRALHLIGIVGIAMLGGVWFSRRGLVAAGALLAIGLLYVFGSSQWPMVRPDIAVSVFAALFMVAAGVAIEKESPLAWGLAGLFAGCGALSHLIAWTLILDAGVVLVAVCAIERASSKQWLVRMTSVMLGGVAAAVMFYGSFAFRIRDHLASLLGYGQFLGGTSTATDGFPAIVGLHLFQAFWTFTRPAQIALTAGVAVSIVLLCASAWQPPALRRRVLALLLPPIVVLGAYLISLGFYANYHAGYAILTQVATGWCIAAAIAVILERFESHQATTALVSLAVVVVSAVQASSGLAAGRMGFVRDWVSIGDYTDEVLELIPEGATAWGTALFGVETPGRIQLIESAEAVATLQRARNSRAVEDAEVAPSYIVWGYPNNRDNTLQVLRPADATTSNVFSRIRGELPSMRYRLIGLVIASPYGVTRVYSRALRTDPPLHIPPLVSLFDVDSQRWQRRIQGPLPVAFGAAEAAAFEIDYGPTGVVLANRSVVADAPRGRLLLRVRLGQSSGSKRPTIVGVTSEPSFKQVMSELGPGVDFSPYALGDQDAYLFHDHPGGRLYISQFDDGEAAAIDGVDVYRILPAVHDEQRAAALYRDMPDLAAWIPLTASSIHAEMTADGLLVDGDSSQQGYQLTGPPVPAETGSTVRVQMKFAGERGKVCVGALNDSGVRWMASGADPTRDFAFVVTDSRAFSLVFHNCNAAASGNPASRFRVADLRYTVEGGLYVDRLMSLLGPAPPASIAALSSPAGLAITSEELSRPAAQLRAADLIYQAPIAHEEADARWVIKGIADGPFAYLLQSAGRRATRGQRLVVSGELSAGGLTIGLLKNDVWDGQVAVTSPGPFVVVIEAAASGEYKAVIANNSGTTAMPTDAVVTRFGWLSQ